MCNVVGIDPGSKGAIAYLFNDTIMIWDMPSDVKELYRFIQQILFKADVACVEKVHPLPGQSCTASFTYGMNFQTALLLAEYTAKETVLVPPQTWKKYFGLKREIGETKTQFKRKSVDLARELFPQCAEQLKYSKDGRAEALLIAEYYRRTHSSTG